MEDKLINIESWVERLSEMYAHTPKEGSSREPEKLMEHLILTIKKLEEFNTTGNCFNYIRALIRDILNEIKVFQETELHSIENFLFKAVLNAVYLHDIGKCNIAFQSEIMANAVFKSEYMDGMSSNHSLASAKIYLDFMLEEGDRLVESNNPEAKSRVINLKTAILRYILVSFANTIVGHHSKLGSPLDFVRYLSTEFGVREEDKIRNLENPPEFKYYTYKTTKTDRVLEFVYNPNLYNAIVSKFTPVAEKMYVLTKWLYSAICLPDSLSTTDYINGVKVLPASFNVETVIENYRKDNIYKAIMEYKETGVINSEINKIRSQMFLESDYNLFKNIDKNIFYLEGPTGSGKTNMSTNLALRVMELTKESKKPITRLIYTAPFNAITTQTAEALEKVLDGCPVDATLVNCSAPIPIKDVAEEFKYQLSLLDNQMLNYHITLTSHVKLFQALFGCSRIDNHMLLNTANSVVVIDEIQAYNPMVWAKMMRLIDVYAKYLNIKFIIMSATLPKIGDLIDEDKRCSEYAELIKDCSKYFVNECFKCRVDKSIYTLTDGDWRARYTSMDKETYRELVFDTLVAKIREEFAARGKCKVLVQFISKKSADEFYRRIRDIKNFAEEEVHIRQFTGDTGSCSRRKTIKLAKEDVNVIIVATQCIEAGVDISMNVGFKDVSYIDSEEQFAGRLNRNFNNKGTTLIYFFKLDEADAVYGKGIATFKGHMTVLIEEYREHFRNKTYSKMFKDMLDRMFKKIHSANIKTNINTFDNEVKLLDYRAVEKELELIPERDEIMLYFPIDVNIEEEDGTIRTVSGETTWSKLQEALSNGDYAKNKVETKNAMVDTSYFCYKFNLPWKMVKDSSLEDVFIAKLKENGVRYTKMAGLFRLDLTRGEIKDFIDFDDDYRFDRENFSAFLGINLGAEDTRLML